ncbi:hypothetical protein [Mesobacterium pallidum]|uniref:hypothetical protein n=1 Tax=Mesobacterium pallidum TaxID=2872037 RepID=UPI001EE2579C|nr:hypothetical protein [Mesobacterium pallidum]
MAVETRGMLFEYGLTLPPLALVFRFNPTEISRTRTVTVRTGNAPGARGGYDFLTPLETARVSQGVEMQAESFSITVLLDATDKLNEGDPIAATMGVQPQIDTLRAMAEPKAQGPGGVKVLSALGLPGARAFERQEVASVLVFAWGLQLLPVFLTSVSQKETMHLPNLMPYRAEMGLTMQVIESANPFFLADKVRQTMGTALNLVGGMG